VEILTTSGADLNAPREEDGRTPLHIAVNEGHADVVEVCGFAVLLLFAAAAVLLLLLLLCGLCADVCVSKPTPHPPSANNTTNQ
jgi:ankyrin repeat protein